MTEMASEVTDTNHVSTLQEELKKKPNDLDAHCRLAWAQFSMDQLEDSVRTFKAAQQRWPDSIEVNYGLGLALKAQGRTEEALESFKRAEMVKPESVRGSMMRQLAEEQKEYLLQMT